MHLRGPSWMRIFAVGMVFVEQYYTDTVARSFLIGLSPRLRGSVVKRSMGKLSAFVLACCLLAACARSSPPVDPPPVSPASPVLDTAVPPPTRPLPSTDTLLPPTATAPPRVTLAAVGDVMLARSVGERIVNDGPSVPFAGVESILAPADLAVANLECVITDRGVPQPKAYTFRAPAAAADSLSLAGLDVIGLANNHSLDYGPEALADTLDLLDERGIAAVGAGTLATAHAPAVVERHGLRVAFLSFVDVPVESRSGFDTRNWIATESALGVAWADPDQIAAHVSRARPLADVVVVLIHFGWEGRTTPSEAQRAEARAAIDAGASLVLGAHPHVLQGVERYGGGLIVYSLGNFVFDGFEGLENYSAIFHATLTPEGVGDYGFTPVVIEGGLPRLATSEESPAILAMLGELP